MNLKTKLELVKVARDLDKEAAIVTELGGMDRTAEVIRTASNLLVSLTEDKPAPDKPAPAPDKPAPAPAKATPPAPARK